MSEIEKVLRAVLDEKLSPINESLQKLGQRIDTLEDGMNKQFGETKSDLRIIREQTAQNSEMQAELHETRDDVENLKLDMKMVKKLILNQ
ncbi:hypothetical protein DFP93_12744 [Aneurinibacillus soli]|uniref:Uncharacterized protein n=1 Tax=Aneurinibacillus soli TaxID=1500254 RepID=A0A0U5BFD7_9BACL|nr:hypothetical protein [Aneurinibacillus soli]PYE57937.1 hypothetical protein DFP93_12744 [Aneurinibacillus soli]BAU26878.1 hypothetical protein CB4_01047 [Aneurinibacillus soli]